MFNFRIITTADGNQIIDRSLKTPYEALTPTQMMEYMEMDNNLAFMDRMERKAREKAEQKFAVEVTVALQRFAVKDWGDMDAEDKQTNEDALNYLDDLYLMGAYNTSKGRIWIITNRISETPGDNATTVCFPDER